MFVVKDPNVGTGVNVTRKNSLESRIPSREDILVHSELRISHCSRSVVPNDGVGSDWREPAHKMIRYSLSESGQTMRGSFPSLIEEAWVIPANCIFKYSGLIKGKIMPRVTNRPKRPVKSEERIDFPPDVLFCARYFYLFA
jgi:hypothetical protein